MPQMLVYAGFVRLVVTVRPRIAQREPVLNHEAYRRLGLLPANGLKGAKTVGQSNRHVAAAAAIAATVLPQLLKRRSRPLSASQSHDRRFRLCLIAALKSFT